MKKILICLLCLFCVGCSSHKSVESQHFDEYDKIKEQLISQNDFEKPIEFDVSLVYNALEDTYRYDIIIDNPRHEMYAIMAMCYANEDNEKMCPSVGIFDDKPYSLKKDYIDKEKGYYKGIQLSGVTSVKQSIKLYVSYYTDSHQTKKIEKYIEVVVK